MARRRSYRGRLFRRGLLWASGTMALWFLLCGVALVYLRYLPPPTTAVQFQRRLEALLGNLPYDKRYTFVPSARISPHLAHAVIAAEDGRFFAHAGVDWEELRYAAEDNWRRKQLRRGGSTITQQLVKNLFFTTHRFAPRKLLELPLVYAAESVLSKPRILELYLNVVEWGAGVYGAEAAARAHYGVSARDLSREQAARLAACLPSPRTRLPRHVNRYAARILQRMQRTGW